MNKNKKAFTLVELIVVITILAILWTIAFISLEWYSRQARDSKRISDIQSIEISLELFMINSWKYPLPDNWKTVSYSWELLRTQWVVWNIVASNLSRNLQKKPTDPLSNVEYIYSVTNSQREYEVMSIYEWDMIVKNNLINTSYAVSNFKPRIEWTYNQVFVKSTNYIVPTPSIINSEVLPLDFKDNPGAIDSSVISWWENMPDTNIVRVPVQTGALDINLSVYDGTIDSNSTDQDKIDAITAIQNAYSWTELANQEPYSNIVSITESEDLIALANFTILNTGTPPLTTTLISVPTNAAWWISFTDLDTNTNQISWDLTITKATDESDIDSYVLYWWSDSTTKLSWQSSIATLSVTWSDLIYNFTENTTVPTWATYLLVYTKNANWEMTSWVSVLMGDNISGWIAILWTASYIYGTSNIVAWLAADSFGNIIVVWTTRYATNDWHIIKYDSEWVELWNKNIDSGSADAGYWVAIDSSDNIIVVWNLSTVWYVKKYDSTWVELWSLNTNMIYANSVAIDSLDNIIVWWTSWDWNRDHNVIKYNNDWTLIWNKVYNTSTTSFWYWVAVDNFDNIILVWDNLIGDDPTGLHTVWLINKYDSSWNNIKTITYDYMWGGRVNKAKRVVVDNSNNIIIWWDLSLPWATSIYYTGINKYDNSLTTLQSNIVDVNTMNVLWLAVDSFDNIFVALNKFSSSIKKYDSNLLSAIRSKVYGLAWDDIWWVILDNSQNLVVSWVISDDWYTFKYTGN